MNLISKLKYSPINVQLVVTRRCNLACGYCNEYDHKSLPVPTKTLIRYFEKLKELGTMSITFSGGEPLMHPEIAKVVKEARKRIPMVSLITNAYLLTEDLIKDFNKAGLKGIQISIDGVNPDKVTVKVLKYIEPKLELLAKYAKFPVNINSVIGLKNPEEAVQVMDTAKKLGFSTTIGLLHDSNGKINLSVEQMKVYKKLEESRRKPWWDRANFEKEIIETGQSPFKSRSGSRYLYIDEFGKVRYCSQMLKMYEKDLMEFDMDDLRENFYKNKPCNKGCTIGCVRRVSWVDGWRGIGNTINVIRNT
jgi:MoaA/NifB/PqqE/SkfB family radical SAM enzyme